MHDYDAFFNVKKITLMGLGVLGRGVGDAEFIASRAAMVTVSDMKTEAELVESIARLSKSPNITFHLGGHEARDFTEADMIIKAAGVPLDSPYVEAAKNAGVPVYMSTALAAKFAQEGGAMIVGVTGTRGKSTVTEMIFHALKSAGRRVHVGGNVRGRSTLAMLPEIEKEDVLVLELDSWQLQGFGDLKLSPHIAVFTNLMPDHMNYYSGDMEKYFADKANIFRFQEAGSVLIAGATVAEKIKAAHPPVSPVVPNERLVSDLALKVLGEHNKENAALATMALLPLGLSAEEIKNGLESFEPVEGRLQFVREVRDVKIYNDNNATTPEATTAALRALGKNITLIAGGSEKNLPLESLVSEIQNRVSRVILLKHDNYKGSARLAQALRVAGISFEEAASLADALALAISDAKTVLFSPAFASFGMFKNEYERNDEFMRIVKELA